MEENILVAMLAAKTSAGVTPEEDLREHVKHTPLPNVNKSAQSGFLAEETSPEVQNGGISSPIKRDLCPPKIFLKNEIKLAV